MAECVFKTRREDSCGIITEPGLLANVGLKLRCIDSEASQAVVIADRNVEALYAKDLAASLAWAGFQCEVLTVTPGESSKSFPVAIHLWDKLVELGFSRRCVLIALGGGVVTDLTGFVAAAFMRGICYASVPTTLMAQLDAAVGGRVGVNHGRAKNLIGFIHHPLAVYNDPILLTTLSQHDVRQGLAEAIKVAVIGSSGLFDYIEAHVNGLLKKEVDLLAEVVAQSIAVKCRLLEHGMHRILNFGHVIGHALETETSFEVTHGDAISIGMATVTRCAKARGLLEEELAQRIRQLLSVAGLPTSTEKLDVSVDGIWEAMSFIRSGQNGQLHEVLPTAIGQCIVTDGFSKSDLQKHIFP